MQDNKVILKYCPNFYKIINFHPLVEDPLTDKIIQMYKEYIFKIDITNYEEIEEIKKLDEAINRYINDYNFRLELQNEIVKVKVRKDCPNILKYFVEQILKIFANYKDMNTRVIYISRWI